MFPFGPSSEHWENKQESKAGDKLCVNHLRHFTSIFRGGKSLNVRSRGRRHPNIDFWKISGRYMEKG